MEMAEPFTQTLTVKPLGHARILLCLKDSDESAIILTHIDEFNIWGNNHRLYAIMNNPDNVGKIEVDITFREVGNEQDPD